MLSYSSVQKTDLVLRQEVQYSFQFYFLLLVISTEVILYVHKSIQATFGSYITGLKKPHRKLKVR